MSIRNVLDQISFSSVRKHLKVRKIAGLGIKVTKAPPIWDRQGRRMRGRLEHLPINCFAYALGLHESPLYRKGLYQWFDGRRIDHVADSRFVEWVVSGWRRTAPHPGCFVVYFEGSVPKHAGILVVTGWVKSKWGLFSEIFEHRLWDVPRGYGSTVRYYNAVLPREAEALLKQAYSLTE